ncbi:MAG: Archaeal DNA polymerase I [Candidatus Fermentimicrarchaeum limneticum]|uniref:DNA polymerase n=1 Tax=Fermentimicrarchaeum limneticum TaxID=2795018 RepID=A0A7D5XII8_FERL1|nr:MAG: Archaeal DNA polymerase I [Candidatus Fermentimicrarchaeum limneticum]
MKGILVDVSYKTKGSEPVISLLLKGKKFFRVYDRSFEPYFYLYTEDLEDAKKEIEQLVVEEKGVVFKVKRIEKARMLLSGKERELLRIICNHPRDVPVLREEITKFGTTYEHNIPFTRRYIIDKGLLPLGVVEFEREGRELKKITKIHDAPSLKFNTMAFDIETYNPQGAPRPNKDPVIMISYADESAGVLTTRRIDKPFIHACADEKEMIGKFCSLLKEKNVELLIGYNSSQFDLPYLKDRAAALKIPLPLGRDGSSFRLQRRGRITKAKITGRIHMDLFHIIRFLATIGSLKTFKYTLTEVYSEITGKKKKVLPKLEIWRYWDDHLKCGELAEYSLNDAVATKELADRLLPMEYEISKLSKVPLFDICGSSTGTIVEQLLMNRAHWENMVVPNQPKEEEITARAASPAVGAFVKMPEPGIYDSLVVFDFRSLYPSIIISHNIDPFTLNCDCCKDAFVSPVGHRFCRKKKGLIPSVLGELLQKRAEIKKKMKALQPGSDEYIQLDARQQALKITANSFYGYLLYPRSRWYSKEAGESTTAWGRHYIQETMKKAEEAGFKVLYGDTDSLMLLLGDKKKKDALEFVDRINSELPEKMELELEGFYTRGVFVSKKAEAKGAKKKYAMIGEDGRIKIRGFELVRRDWAGVAKSVQEQVLGAILKEGSKEKAVKIVMDKIDELRAGKTPLDELVIYTQLKKCIGKYEITSPELEAAKKAMKAGMLVEEGSLISYVITRKGTSISDKAVPVDQAQDYDADYYINHQVIPAVLKILKELGVKKDDLLLGGKQSSLGDWH